MKKIFGFSLVFFLTFLIGFNVDAQRRSRTLSDSDNESANVIKLGLGSAIIWQNLNLKYERSFDQHHSFQLGLVWDIPNQFLNGSNISDGTSFLVGHDINKKGFFAVPEYRYYFGKKGAPAGFYLGAYAKLGTTKLYAKDVLVTDEKIPTDIYISSGTIAAGAQMGVQWVLSNRVTIDWNIAGLGFARHKVRVGFDSDEIITVSKEDILEYAEDLKNDVNGTDIVLEEKQQLNDAIDEVAANLDGFSTDSYKSIGIPIPWLDVRFGLSIGYSF